MKVIASYDVSAGNETVGDMWTETAIFDIDTPISKVLEWADICKLHDRYGNELSPYSRVLTKRNVKLSIAQEPMVDEK